jgi:hypothetical protein
MQIVANVVRGVYKNLETGFYKFIVLDNKPEIDDYIKIVSTYRNNPTEMWMKVVLVQPYSLDRWKADLIHETPQISEETDFKLEVNYDPEWF